MDERACSKCGAVHRLIKKHYPFRDTDTEDCKVCGEKLIGWTKSTTYYVAELIEK